ncbi:unnamed protein product [Heligmosomoides polygyrus]|uniref:Transposase n=1 Tax=Heligmosomoides polygyrus TaxID=6339 RepID=A0A3P7ZDR4_HELPZ|nr:unnamed protein product [Heligmosomoides polygyrus]
MPKQPSGPIALLQKILTTLLAVFFVYSLYYIIIKQDIIDRDRMTRQQRKRDVRWRLIFLRQAACGRVASTWKFSISTDTTVVSQTYRQFCAPVFRRCFAYAWVTAGYVDTHPGHFSTPADYAFDEVPVDTNTGFLDDSDNGDFLDPGFLNDSDNDKFGNTGFLDDSDNGNFDNPGFLDDSDNDNFVDTGFLDDSDNDDFADTGFLDDPDNGNFANPGFLDDSDRDIRK